jgi:hypothetical protein
MFRKRKHLTPLLSVLSSVCDWQILDHALNRTPRFHVSKPEGPARGATREQGKATLKACTQLKFGPTLNFGGIGTATKSAWCKSAIGAGRSAGDGTLGCWSGTRRISRTFSGRWPEATAGIPPMWTGIRRSKLRGAVSSGAHRPQRGDAEARRPSRRRGQRCRWQGAAWCRSFVVMAHCCTPVSAPLPQTWRLLRVQAEMAA